RSVYAPPLHDALPICSWAQTGYTESVNFDGTGPSWGDGSGRPQVWIFLPEGMHWSQVVPFGLLRGKVLEIFDGKEWRPGAKSLRSEEHTSELQSRENL